MVVVLDFFLLLDFTLKHLKRTLDFTAESVLTFNIMKKLHNLFFMEDGFPY